MKNRHAWTERDPDGSKREFVAHKFGGKWTLRSKADHEEDWSDHDPPSCAELGRLRDILWRKYQRRRASHEDVSGIDKWIESRR